MKNTVNIAVIGLGQIGSYLLNELKNKKKRYQTFNWEKYKISCYFSKK